MLHFKPRPPEMPAERSAVAVPRSAIRSRGTTRRRLASSILALAMATGLSAPGLLGAQPVAATDDVARVEATLLEQLEQDDVATFWVVLDEQAPLSIAAAVSGWEARGTHVHRELTAAADRAQHGIRALLTQRGADWDAFWIVNTIRVTGDADLVAELADRPEVAEIVADRVYSIPEPEPAPSEPVADEPADEPSATTSVEWGIDRIGAPDVWAEFDATGEGIVVASIDTGVQFDHPALIDQYRGNVGDGELDHNYNWYDPSYVCGFPSVEPCDNHGHGTHVTGTMVGDDGTGNQIGAAPGARWIAAKGCELDTQCSLYALLSAGQWVLAPTDLAGRNPDPAKRPSIVNSSWGSISGSDTFYQATVQAWVAAGIFPTFANGNSGPNCGLVSSPASYPESFGVGGFDINNDIYAQSSRGPALASVGGEIKPQITAPAVSVRSSVIGNGYASFTGTSMAAPHVSGAVALMWSAAPGLVGNVEATREILTQTAIDTEDLTCGGTPENNNVWGEGRLDAFAAVEAAPKDPIGTLAGAVTDDTTDRPIPGAAITVGDLPDRTATTGSDGTYQLILPVGSHDVTVEAFGYASQTHRDVPVEDRATTTQDVRLDPIPMTTVSGTVSDDSGQGWPLYARIEIDGHPGETTFTDPQTGRYRLRLPSDAAHTLQVESLYPSYQPVAESIEVGPGDATHDIGLSVAPAACAAPGYQHVHHHLFESFDEPSTPADWTVLDHTDTDQLWRFDDPIQRGNTTGGDGGFALVDSFQFDRGPHDTSLVSPVVDLSDAPTPEIGFNTDFHTGLGNATAEVDVSVDGGATWETVWQRDETIPGDPPTPGFGSGPAEVLVPVPQAAGAAAARVRFHFTGISAFWWKVDDVFVGTRTCDPTGGGLVVGHVRDRNTGAGLKDATVTSHDRPDDQVTSAPTPDDAQLDDGFYWTFSPLTGPQTFTAASRHYVDDTVTVDVEPHATTPLDFSLAAGRVSVAEAVAAPVQLGDSTTMELAVTNDGSAPVQVQLSERDGTFELLSADGSRTTRQQMAAMEGAPRQRVPAEVSWSAVGGTSAPDTGAAQPSAPPWTDVPDYPVAVQDNAVGVWAGKVYSFGGRTSAPVADSYVYDPASQRWTEIAPMLSPRQQSAGAFIEGKFYLVGGWDATGATTADTFIYDPASDSWSTAATSPVARAAAGAAVLDGKLYAVGGCTGSCGFDDVLRYDPEADTWEKLAPYPQLTSWLACGGLADKVYCAGGVGFRGFTSTATYAYDPHDDRWTRVADMPYDFAGAGYVAANDRLLVSGGAIQGSSLITNEGTSYNPATDTWSPLPNANHARFRGGSGCGFYRVGGLSQQLEPSAQVEVLPGHDDCGPTGVSWLEAAPASLTLAPSESQVVTVTLDARAAAQPGTYAAEIVLDDDTPYPASRLPVAMHVEAPRTWGKLTGTVAGESCDGSTSPLPGATVQVQFRDAELTLTTEVDGAVAHWLDSRGKPPTLIVAKDGWQPQTRTVTVKPGKTTSAEFILQPVGAC